MSPAISINEGRQGAKAKTVMCNNSKVIGADIDTLLPL